VLCCRKLVLQRPNNGGVDLGTGKRRRRRHSRDEAFLTIRSSIMCELFQVSSRRFSCPVLGVRVFEQTASVSQYDHYYVLKKIRLLLFCAFVMTNCTERVRQTGLKIPTQKHRSTATVVKPLQLVPTVGNASNNSFRLSLIFSLRSNRTEKLSAFND
jgi:hypothetical protein